MAPPLVPQTPDATIPVHDISVEKPRTAPPLLTQAPAATTNSHPDVSTSSINDVTMHLLQLAITS
jgi:hypothetical protein